MRPLVSRQVAEVLNVAGEEERDFLIYLFPTWQSHNSFWREAWLSLLEHQPLHVIS